METLSNRDRSYLYGYEDGYIGYDGHLKAMGIHSTNYDDWDIEAYKQGYIDGDGDRIWGD